MPSYIGHITCAEKLMERLNLNKEDRVKFIIGNLIPDIKQVDIDYSLDEFINRKNIQKSKRVTHFRRVTNKILEFPNCDVFLKEYEDKIKKHIETLAYFFHLCTDYYYFRFFLPKEIAFLDSSYNPVKEIDHFYYVKIKKSGQIIKAKAFFSKLNNSSLYKEYVRSNSYLIRKYNLNLDINYMREYVTDKGFNSYVDEINTTKIYDVFNRLDKVYKNLNHNKMLIFEENDLDEFVNNVVEIFIKEYGYLLKKYGIDVN